MRDLTEAQTLYQAKVAAHQMEGAVSHWLAPSKKELVDLMALREAGIDFAEDDVSVLSQADVRAQLSSVAQQLQRIAESFRTGKIIHQGLTLAIVGRPNVGKSGLFNCLVEQDRAIVSATPARRGDGIAELPHAVLEAALPALSGHREAQFLTNLRHEQLVGQAVEALQAAQSAVAENLPHEMLLLDPHNALRPLNAITGETTVEDILTPIF